MKINLYIFQAFIPLIIIAVMTMGVGLILATCNVFFRDLEYLWTVVLMLIMYTSAIFYKVENLLLLGRVSSGQGGSIVIEEAKRVLATAFPELHIDFLLPDETFKRHGQAVIAATL